MSGKWGSERYVGDEYNKKATIEVAFLFAGDQGFIIRLNVQPDTMKIFLILIVFCHDQHHSYRPPHNSTLNAILKKCVMKFNARCAFVVIILFCCNALLGQPASYKTANVPSKSLMLSDYEFGWAISPAGDVNGDHYGDIIVRSAANIYVYYGSASGVNNTANWTIACDQLYGQFTSVASAGDVNHDGYGDIIVGGMGKVMVYYGSASGLSSVPNWTVLLNASGRGNQVSSAGDVNHDGYGDVIAGNDTQTFVYYGSASGLPSSPNWSISAGYPFSAAGDVNGDGYGDVIAGGCLFCGSATGLNNVPVWTTPSGFTPATVAPAGDVNGDGFSDVVMSSGNNILCFYGSATGFHIAPDWVVQNVPNSVHFGSSVTSAGDVNGDGYSDIIVGDYLYNNHVVTSYGNAFIYYGSGTGLRSSPNWKAQGGRTCLCTVTSNFAWSVSSAGDINGDGFSDVMVSEPQFYSNEFGPKTGAVYVYNGSSVMGAPIALPLTYLNFSATGRNNQVYLQWQTAGASRNNFLIERSSDAQNFKEIGEVAATKSDGDVYQFWDYAPTTGNNYYRLKQADINGAYTYSLQKLVVFADEKQFLRINSNPARSNLEFTIPTAGPGSIFQACIYNNQGQIIKQWQDIKDNPARLNITDVSAGAYILQVRDQQNTVWTGKFIKE